MDAGTGGLRVNLLVYCAAEGEEWREAPAQQPTVALPPFPLALRFCQATSCCRGRCCCQRAASCCWRSAPCSAAVGQEALQEAISPGCLWHQSVHSARHLARTGNPQKSHNLVQARQPGHVLSIISWIPHPTPYRHLSSLHLQLSPPCHLHLNPQTTLLSPYPAPCTPQPLPFTPYPSPHTLHPIPFTHTLHPTPLTPRSVPRSSTRASSAACCCLAWGRCLMR
jgi:hypothetical protein